MSTPCVEARAPSTRVDSTPVTETATPTRSERKERTRRAILDAALELGDETSFVALSLRQVAKEVGIVPTAFYRHFDSLESLGLELVDESFTSLRAMLREVRQIDPSDGAGGLRSFTSIVDASVDILADHVRRQRRHFLFIARERAAGPPTVREAIRHEIELCERELATDLVRLPGTQAWSSEDLRTLSHLIVVAMVATAEAVLVAGGRRDAEEAVLDRARTELRMLLIGALRWSSEA